MCNKKMGGNSCTTVTALRCWGLLMQRWVWETLALNIVGLFSIQLRNACLETILHFSRSRCSWGWSLRAGSKEGSLVDPIWTKSHIYLDYSNTGAKSSLFRLFTSTRSHQKRDVWPREHNKSTSLVLTFLQVLCFLPSWSVCTFWPRKRWRVGYHSIPGREVRESIGLIHRLTIKKEWACAAGARAQQLRALVLPGDLSLIPSTHKAAYSSIVSKPSGFFGHQASTSCTDIHTGRTLMHMK